MEEISYSEPSLLQIKPQLGDSGLQCQRITYLNDFIASAKINSLFDSTVVTVPIATLWHSEIRR